MKRMKTEGNGKKRLNRRLKSKKLTRLFWNLNLNYKAALQRKQLRRLKVKINQLNKKK